LNLPVDVTLDTLRTQAQELQHAADDGSPTFEDDLTGLLEDLFTKRRRAIPTPSKWLNRALRGGWQAGKVYVMCGPPLACTTDFCAWCADYAAYRRFPVLYVSYSMSREELSLRALSRHSGIDAEQIVMHVSDTADADAREGTTLQEHLLETVDRLGKRIAHYLTVLEGDAETTITEMRDVVNVLRHRAGRDVNDPLLVVVDPVQMMPAESVLQCRTSDEMTGMQRIFTLLKQFAREAKVVVLALFALTESSYKGGIQSRTDTVTVREVSASLESAHAVDSILLLQVGEVRSEEGSSEETIDQFHRSWDQYKRWFSRRRDHVVIDESFSDALTAYPLDRYTSSYARISLLKNLDGILADPVVIYERPYHRFIPVDIDLTALEGVDE
jgi:replicative DNA helicase